MYADEMVLFSESIHELKKMIDVVCVTLSKALV
jgi:hypothetical protein